MLKDEIATVLALEGHLGSRVIGQDHALVGISQRIRTSRASLDDPEKPVGVFLLVGPSGVGKTETALALSDLLYGGEQNVITINMSEFQEAHTVSTLKGSPPGYVGYGEGGVLTEAVRRRPYSVVLLDEIEKAHPDVFNMLLQIMEEGHLTDSFGRKVDFKNTVIIMTTNVGASAIHSGDVFGFGKKDEDSSYEKMKERLKHEIEREFKPEFLGRVDDIIVFRHLTRDDLKRIIDIELAKVRERLWERGLKLVLTDSAKEFIIDKGSDLDFGARPLRRAIEGFIEDPLSEELLKGTFEGKNQITVNLVETGDQKHLSLDATVEPEQEQLAAVGSEAGGAEAASEAAKQ